MPEQPATYVVTFDRIGRSHNVEPLEVTLPEGFTDPQRVADLLSEAVYKYARGLLVSREVEVDVELDLALDGVVTIFAGIQNGGTGTARRQRQPLADRGATALAVVLAVVALLASMLLAAPSAYAAHRHPRATSTAVSATPVAYGDLLGETATLYGARSTAYPTVVYVHGGGWVRGGLTSSEGTFARDLSGALGWPVLAIDYPTTAQGDIPAFKIEAQAVNDAVHFAAHLPGTDPAHIVLWGESAGGDLALLDSERDTTHTHPRVSAAVSISGPTDLRDEWRVCDEVMPNNNFVTQYEGETPAQADAAGHTRYADTSPLGQAVAGQPPIFQAVGTADPIAPTAQIEGMDSNARSVGAGSVLYELDGVADHAADLELDVIAATGNTVERQAEAFLFTHYAARS